MSLTLAAIKLLRDKGLTLDDVIEVAEACQEGARSSGAERQARYRERKARSDVTGDVTRDVTRPPPPDEKAPEPQKTLTPSPKENPPKGGQKKGTRLPDDWQPSEALCAYAAEHGVSGDWLAREAERFRNFWHGKSGKDAAKASWDATWKNWILRAAENGPPRIATGPPMNGRAMTDDEKARFQAEMREKMRNDRQARQAALAH